LNGEPIDIYNNGEMLRDFTYVDDVVEAISLLLDKIPEKDTGWSIENPNPSTSVCRYRILNIGNDSPVLLRDFIALLEQSMGKIAEKKYLPIQPGDVKDTHAKVDVLYNLTGFRPKTELKDGLKLFAKWFKIYSELN
jgi:UDP-glucuronate 4-epimerase